MVEDGYGTGSASRGRLTSREVAELLGVKVETVYAYASRGMLRSERIPGGRGSTFDAAAVERLREAGRPRPRVASADAVGDLPATRSALTLVDGGRLHYRGVDAVDLVARHGFEAVAGWLWHERIEPSAPFVVPGAVLATLRRAGENLPARSRLTDRLRVAVTVAAASDPLRFDLREDNVLLTARALIAALVESLPGAALPTPPSGEVPDIASRLWSRLATVAPDPGAVANLDDALGLLADHDLAVSTVAARVAASARADPYAVVSAGLAALDGPLHGGASRLAYRMLTEVIERGDGVLVVSEYLRAGQPIPGIGHSLYPDGDPRARALLLGLADVPTAAPYLAAARQVSEATARDRALRPNVDLALAVLTLAAGMPAEAGEVIFAVARTVGWIAHALEEYREPPLRMRPRGSYVGPRPPRPVP